MIKDLFLNRRPKIGVILGSGLGDITDILEDKIEIPYDQFENIPKSTVKGHAGKFVLGRINGNEVLFMNGRIHLYEGVSEKTIFDFIKIIKDAGVTHLIVTNAAGSLKKIMPAGSIMLINDHINFSSKNPLIGTKDDGDYKMFTDMVNAYDKTENEIFKKIAKTNKIKLFSGVYLWALGPNFETPAEIKMFRKMGADAVGMSTVPEVLVARYFKMKVSGFSIITNYGAGMEENVLSHEQTLKMAKQGAEKLKILLISYLKKQVF